MPLLSSDLQVGALSPTFYFPQIFRLVTFLRSSSCCTFPHNPYSISFNLSVFSSSRLRLSNLLNVSVANYLKCIIATPGIATSDLALIWDLSDRNKVGALDLLGLSTAIKLVALVQNGIQPTAENLK